MQRSIFTWALAALLMCATALSAQEGTQNLGLYLGYANPILRQSPQPTTHSAVSKDVSTKVSEKNLMSGFTLGLVYETTFVKGFGLQMGLNYTLGANSGKWEQATSTSIYPKKKNNFFYHTLEVPVDWQYKFEIAKETYLLLYTGPTISVGFGLQNKLGMLQKTPQGEKETYSTSKYFDLDEDADGEKDYRRVNIMWGVGAGFQYKNYFLRGGYDFGIMSPYRDPYYNGWYTDGSDWNRRGRFDQWSLKLGIYFWQF